MTPYERAVEFEARMQLTAALDQTIAPLLAMADRLERELPDWYALHPSLGAGGGMLESALRGFAGLLERMPENLRRQAEARHVADVEAGRDLEP